MTLTEEAWNAEEAADVVDLAIDVETKKPLDVVIFDIEGRIAQNLDKHLARAVAVRLVELAEKLPEPRRILRRVSRIDDDLREVDGL